MLTAFSDYLNPRKVIFGVSEGLFFPFVSKNTFSLKLMLRFYA